MKLRHGMTVMTARYAVVLRGRNQCFPDQWWGHPIIEGKIMKRHTIVLKAEDVVALPRAGGFPTRVSGIVEGIA